jgi:hypothetical protein
MVLQTFFFMLISVRKYFCNENCEEDYSSLVMKENTKVLSSVFDRPAEVCSAFRLRCPL